MNSTQAILKSSSAVSGDAMLLHCRPSNLRSNRDITSTPAPMHVLDSTQNPIFAPLWEKKNRDNYSMYV